VINALNRDLTARPVDHRPDCRPNSECHTGQIVAIGFLRNSCFMASLLFQKIRNLRRRFLHYASALANQLFQII
jgi:hypothetical protein